MHLEDGFHPLLTGEIMRNPKTHVRGILNKLTPEKFEKLIEDIVNLGLDSTVIIKGVILLIFEKSLDEPKYSSMYAQLCKRLNDYTTSLEPDGTRTFKRLLLNKCRNEFENRARISQQYDNKCGGSECDADAKFSAKRKMLGNIKFIGELGKLEMLHDSILHRCCEQLLVGKRKQPLSDQAEDLECLCHLMKTCGKILDTNKAKGIMDQYFVRMAAILENGRMSTRIRFMIQDVIEMRKNNWVPRKVGKAPDGPKTIQQVREDAYRDGCIYLPQDAYAGGPMGISNNQVIMGIPNPLEGTFFDKKNHNGDFFGGGSSGSGSGIGSFLNGPGNISYDNGFINSDYSIDRGSHERDLPSYSNKSSRNNDYDRRDNVFSSGGRRSPGNNYHYDHDQRRNRLSDNRSDYGENRYSGNRNKDYMNSRYNNNGDGRYGDNRYHSSDSRYNRFGNRSPQNNNIDDRRYRIDNGQSGRSYNNPSNSLYRNDNDNVSGSISDINNGERLPPRFKKIIQQQGNSKDASGDVSLRPQPIASSMVLKPKTPSLLPKSAISKVDGHSTLGENSLMVPPQNRMLMQQKESPMIIKQGYLDKGRKDKNKASKGPTKEEVIAKIDTLLEGLNDHNNVITAFEAWKEVNSWLPLKMNQTAINYLFRCIVENKTKGKRLAFDFICQLAKEPSYIINGAHCIEALSKIIATGPSKESSLIPSRNNEELSELAAWIIIEEFMSLNEYSSMVKGDYPLFFITLSKMLKSLGKDRLEEIFNSFDISLTDHVPIEDKSEDKMVLILDDYGLTFLAPLLSVRREMNKQLATDNPIEPSVFHKWILQNVSDEYYKQPKFILALYSVVMEYIVSQTTLPQGTDPTQNPERFVSDKEKELLSSFKSVLRPFVQDSTELQLVAVYALQVFCNSHNYPKGMLLRCFVNFYEMDIMDEKAFFHWKEDVKHTDIYPGKERALFQVNSWFTWLEEAESEEDEEDED